MYDKIKNNVVTKDAVIKSYSALIMESLGCKDDQTCIYIFKSKTFMIGSLPKNWVWTQSIKFCLCIKIYALCLVTEHQEN